MEDHNKAFGEALRHFRKTHHLSQEKLAEIADIDRTYISLLELGSRSPTLDTVVPLCRAMTLRLDEFFQKVEELIANG